MIRTQFLVSDPRTRFSSAGVIFLGDLWHERGALPVGPLNSLLETVSAWRVPSLWLVGNHDQARHCFREAGTRRFDSMPP